MVPRDKQTSKGAIGADGAAPRVSVDTFISFIPWKTGRTPWLDNPDHQDHRQKQQQRTTFT
jgi:hypothetical protein